MPNWVDQTLAVYGPADDIARFCALALTGNFSRSHTLDDEPTFRFDLACPVLAEDEANCEGEHRSGVIFRCLRSDVFLRVEMQTSCTYPSHFYATRMARDWPSLHFICALNEDMGAFGGIVARIGGEFVDRVADYEAPFDRRRHGAQVGAVRRRWYRLIEGERPWRVELPLVFRCFLTYRADATLDMTGMSLRFRERTDVERFVKRRVRADVFRRSARSGRERRVRLGTS